MIQKSRNYATLRGYATLTSQKVYEYAKRGQHPLTVQEMIDTSKTPTDRSRLANAQYLYDELPIRLAKCAQELESLPYGLSMTDAVLDVKQWYIDSFTDMVVAPYPKSYDDLQPFIQVLHTILKRHKSVVPTMAKGILQVKAQHVDSINECPFLQDFLDHFYLSRIGLRQLISQQIAMMEADNPVDYAGTIALQLNPVEVAEAAISNASRVCERNYGMAPDVEMLGPNGADPDLRIEMIPTHLHHILYEVLKNSFRAVMEKNGVEAIEVPPVSVIFSEGEQDWVIKVSDQGGGIKRHDVKKCWSYLHTTAERPEDLAFFDGLGHAPMAGLGYGLPLSRLFARYFGGDIQLVSMDGYGTDVYIFINKEKHHGLEV